MLATDFSLLLDLVPSFFFYIVYILSVLMRI